MYASSLKVLLQSLTHEELLKEYLNLSMNSIDFKNPKHLLQMIQLIKEVDKEQAASHPKTSNFNISNIVQFFKDQGHPIGEVKTWSGVLSDLEIIRSFCTEDGWFDSNFTAICDESIDLAVTLIKLLERRLIDSPNEIPRLLPSVKGNLYVCWEKNGSVVWVCFSKAGVRMTQVDNVTKTPLIKPFKLVENNFNEVDLSFLMDCIDGVIYGDLLH